MSKAIRFAAADFQKDELQKFHVPISRGEVLMNFFQKNACLPVVYRGQNRLFAWGAQSREFGVPITGFCKLESFKSGRWQWLRPRDVLILASAVCTHGVWYQVRVGLEGIIVLDRKKIPRVYIITQPATHYFRTMTGADRMPILRDQIL